MVGAERREHLYGAFSDDTEAEGCSATRMIREERFKLIYYPVGNICQLFDMHQDPQELHDLADDPHHADTLARLQGRLVEHLATDTERGWLRDGRLTGLPDAAPAAPQPVVLRPAGDPVAHTLRGDGFSMAVASAWAVGWAERSCSVTTAC